MGGSDSFGRRIRARDVATLIGRRNSWHLFTMEVATRPKVVKQILRRFGRGGANAKEFYWKFGVGCKTIDIH